MYNVLGKLPGLKSEQRGTASDVRRQRGFGKFKIVLQQELSSLPQTQTSSNSKEIVVTQ